MRGLLLVLLLGLSCAGTGTGWAQQATPGGAPGAAPSATPGPGQCARLVAWAEPFAERDPAGPMEEMGGNGCRFGRVRFGTGLVGYMATSVLVWGLPLAEHAGGAVRVEARGLKLAVHTWQPKMEWMQEQQVTSIDAVADFEYDPVAHRLALHELSMDGEAVGRVSLEGLFEGVPEVIGSTGRASKADDVRVRALRVRLDSRRFLAGFLFPAVIPMLPDEDFVAGFERMRAMAAAVAVQVVSATGGAARDREALLGFIRDVPQPVHAFELSFEAGAAAVRPSELAAALEKGVGLEALLAGSHVTASYEGPAR